MAPSLPRYLLQFHTKYSRFLISHKPPTTPSHNEANAALTTSQTNDQEFLPTTGDTNRHHSVKMPNTSPPQSKEDTPPPGSSELTPTATMPADGAAPQTFHRFMELPPELRIAIWEFSLPHRVHTFPTPLQKFHFRQKFWTQEQVHTAKAAQPSAIARVCCEARAVALSNGSVKKIMVRGQTKQSDRLGHVWVDPKRDTVVINLSRCIPKDGKLYKCRNNDHLYSLLRNRDMRVAFDYSWVMVGFFEGRGRQLYHDFVKGLKDCDFAILDLQLDVTDEEAASTGLFGESGADSSILIPIEDTRQMSRVFDAYNKFNTANFLQCWENFTQPRHPKNLLEFVQCWKELAARKIRDVQRGLDHLMGVPTGLLADHEEDEFPELRLRDSETRRSYPSIRPVVMVSRGAHGLP